jgi:hypothetical protein
MGFEVQVREMRKDAKEWVDVATTCGNAQAAANRLTLTTKSLSWAADDTGLMSTYQQIQARMARLLGEGANEYTNLSTTLYGVARAYEENDQKAAADLGAAWKPK